MYNFNLLNEEELTYVFDDILVGYNNDKVITTIAITNKRLLFLDYLILDDELRSPGYQNRIKIKEVYHSIYLSNIAKIKNNIIFLDTNEHIEIDNPKLIKLLKNEVNL